jgi:hypothetical protein
MLEGGEQGVEFGEVGVLVSLQLFYFSHVASEGALQVERRQFYLNRPKLFLGNVWH